RTTCILYSGRPALLLHVRDITERRRAEEALRQAEEKYRGIFENAVVGLSQTTPDGRFLTVNSSLARMLGYESPAEMLAAVTDIARQLYARAEDRAEVIRLLRQHGVVHRFETQFVRKDGSRIWVSMHARAVLDANGQIERIEGTVVDITRRKQLEEELRQAQKMEAVGRLAGGVAHDFNNMMMAILGYSEMLLDQLPKESPYRKEVEEILQAGERAADLTRELLAFSRQQILQPKVINLNEVVLAVSKMLRRLISENIELIIQTADDLGSVQTDPGQMGQVVMNLALNGRDAMPGGGQLIIQTANCALDEAAAQQHVGLTAGDYVTLTVSDTGKGMDPEMMAHLFEPFFTTKDRARGSGLGLSIVYGIIKQSGGHIHVQSEPDRGSTFTIYLPRVEQPAEPVALPQPTAAPARGTETVLVAEDEDTVRNLVSEVLRRNGYTVLAARDGSEALALAGRQQGPIHLLLTDMVMPGLGGHELAERLARVRPDTKVLYMSGYTDNDIVRQGALKPETAFLQKPFAPEVLTRRIRELLDARTPQPPAPS
ncbi:MAG: PAS domain S-box protein, partial [Verrucomicrobia bacterium]|nr:PAS domain S-box protein [Verrucomicrobiota bacterium]